MHSPPPPPPPPTTNPPQIWWTNSIFFVSVHLAAIYGAYVWPVSRINLALSFILWQLGNLGITIGYHRLYSHRAFRASIRVRVILAAMGSSAFQGSIKWWCLRHRLHHRFTDDPVHDPYAATRGLFYSHMGWIFFKPIYERINIVDRDDLLNDPVVRFQHKYYVPIALLLGFVFPSALGLLWGDICGAFIWGGLVSKIAIWHCTFLVNSRVVPSLSSAEILKYIFRLAHWHGLQPYSDEDTSRGNFILALLASGEGNHNFHAFPYDFRSGPAITTWDPSKWIILTLHYFGLATGLRRAREKDMFEATMHMRRKHQHGTSLPDVVDGWEGQAWNRNQLKEHVKANSQECLLLINGFVIDATRYQREHPGGAGVIHKYSISSQMNRDEGNYMDASWAFGGGLNNHSRIAKRRMDGLRIAKFIN